MRDEDVGLGRKLAIITAFRIGFVTISFAAVFFAARQQSGSPPPSTQLMLVFVAYAVSVVYALALRSNASKKALAYVQLAVDSVLVSLLLVTTGGVESVLTFTYSFVVIGGAMTLYRSGAFLAAGGSLLCLSAIAVVQVESGIGSMPRVDAVRAMLSLFTHTLSLILVALLAGQLTESLRRTGRRLLEKETELSRLEALHAAILRSLPAGVLTIDASLVIRYANDAALAILRLAPDELVGKVLPERIPEMTDSLAAYVARQNQSEIRQRFECVFERAGGARIRIGYSFAPLAAGADDETIVVFQDVTEIVRLKDAIERAERLATVGKLAAGLAHEIRNPLSSMCASIDVLKNALSPPESLRRLMDNTVNEGSRLNKLISEFLLFARPRDPVLYRVDVSELAASVADLLRVEADKAGCTLKTALSPGVWVDIDADMIRQVVWNLAKNAIEAVQAGHGTVWLETRAHDTWAEIVVADDGPGIPSDTIARIFEPFFSTKDRGTGLGLAIAHAIVLAHGGHVWVTSAPNERTEFVVRLPLPLESTSGAASPA